MAWVIAGRVSLPAKPLISISIRTKLLLVSLTLLVVPWLGYQYVQGLESYLRDAQEQRLADRVTVVASVMDGQQTLFRQQGVVTPALNIDVHTYVRPLHSAIQLDGYDDDWLIYQDREQQLGNAQVNDDISVRYRLGSWNGYLYMFLAIRDDQLVYRQPNSLYPGRSDHLRIGLQTPEGDYKRYRMTTISPGWVNAYEMPKRLKEMLPQGSEFRIKGEWQEVHGGYNLEIRIPVSMIGDRFSFAVADVDDIQSRKVEQVVALADTEHAKQLATIVIPTVQMETLLQRLKRPQSRIWVVDTAKHVIGLTDNLNQPMEQVTNYPESNSWFSGIMRLFYSFILSQPNGHIHDSLSSVSRLDNPVVTSALKGEVHSSWRTTDNENTSIITAAHPVYIGDEIVGAVVIEETSNSILLLQNRAIEALVNMSLVAFVLTIGLLLTFATRLSMRVRRLRNEVESSISDDGRIHHEISPSRAGDELGDLGRSFYNMHQRLAQYNRYLESMASKLSHELRTPITIVRSSLDNLTGDQTDEERAVYVQRANDGVKRLSGILTRMSEATHLEQTLQQEEFLLFDVVELLGACVDGYRLAHPQQSFVLQAEVSSLSVMGAPELVAQMLDKLVGNAIDFANQDSDIVISIKTRSNHAVISVVNEGPVLPSEMTSNLFDSMVSMRGTDHKGEQPHLGLGLYIVRLIAESHKGHVEVANLPNGNGVIFNVILPLP